MARYKNIYMSVGNKFGNLINKLKSGIKPKKKLKRREEILELYKKIQIPESASRREMSSIISREYRIFKKEEMLSRKLTTVYEKLCKIAEGILKINPDKKTKEKIEKAIKIAHLNITPQGAASLTILSCFAICLIALILIITNLFIGIGLPLGRALLVFGFSVPISYYLYMYPMRLEKRFMTKIGSEVSFLILYMVVYMRESPNLEGAVEFASRNLTGPLAWDMRKLIWDVEVGKYRSIEEALINYVTIWVNDRYFIEAIQMLRSSLRQAEERRLMMLDEAVDLVLSGTREKAKYYSQTLKMPILLIHALGILLPVMGLVLFPILGIFLDVKSGILFIGYDIILPLILFFFILNILEERPTTFSKLTISENPDMPPPGKFMLKLGESAYFVPVVPVAVAVSAPITILGLWMYLQAPGNNLTQSVIITTGILTGFFAYYFLSSFQKVKLREVTRKIETEFTEALFQLGNHVSTGVPIETAVSRAIRSISGLDIKKLFQIVLRNMQRLGMTFSQALFDKDYGALLFYPSTLVRSVMRIVTDAASKGIQIVALTMTNISRHLKNIHETQEQIHDQLNDVMSSLRFQAFLLTPLVSGIVVTMATIVIKIMGHLSTTIANIKSQAYMMPLMPFGQLAVTPGEFQLVCSIYFIETSILIGMLLNGIENGEDEIGRQSLTASILGIGFIVYVISLFITLTVFEPLTVIRF